VKKVLWSSAWMLMKELKH